ncbi:histone-lysine N-methyltransferase 2D isoform X2 [Synchiropus splendidus]|uniref:histone-lysine N-methyltransferase 2D isoform X2 n=1 Tax=Synchiropus splendidus TaxID=270530 RepID=UPI00237DCDC9|nr:histone-lysine N-methyltransferase 2D isoform X2 [Synchiropus splendidus]
MTCERSRSKCELALQNRTQAHGLFAQTFHVGGLREWLLKWWLALATWRDALAAARFSPAQSRRPAADRDISRRRSLSQRSGSVRGMDEQKSNCDESESEPTADDKASSQQLVSSDGGSKPLPPVKVASSPPGESVQVCALCNCTERSLHGQRELRLFGKTPERPLLLASASTLLRPGNDDLSSIGFSDTPAALLDDSGACWVHHWCAVWSEGVERKENEALENVDKAVISGTQQRCEYCKRLGASIRCHIEGCSRFYHFPCAAASGSFQSMKRLLLLCSEHIHKAEELAGEESWCAVCDSAGELADLLFCTGCGLHYHAACLEIGATPIQRAGWQCPECKVCQTCRQPGEDSKMLVCDACDKGYHTFCLQPAMESLPSDPWKCRRCRTCTECGVRGVLLSGSAQWFDNYSVCESCQRQRTSTCVVCSKATDSSIALQCCNTCLRWVHSECASHRELPESKCVCLLCHEDRLQQLGRQTKEASEETEGQVHLVEMIIQTDADMISEEHRDLTDVTLSQKDSSDTPPAGEEEKETQMELGADAAVDADSPVKQRNSCPPAAQTRAEETPDSTSTASQSSPSDRSSKQQVSVEQHLQAELLQTGSGSSVVAEAPKLPTSGAIKTEYLPSNHQQEDGMSTHGCSLEGNSRRDCSTVDVERDLLQHSEEEEDDEDDDHMKGDELDYKQERDIKSELLLDETSNISQGDESSSGFLGSPGEPDTQLSSDLGLLPRALSHHDNLLTETDDSLPFEPLRSDREKVKRRGSPGRSRVKQGRSNSFPGRRRPRGGGGGRGRGGRSRLKAMASCIDAFLLSMTADSGLSKEEDDDEDDTMQNTVVLFSNTDKFVLLQDMCVVCGSFGKGAEGQLLACAQCAQCYHPYCVNSKITKTMLRKGWRCLECIVCEVCGKASDPSRLLLCDDCDVSYHTYCLDPPLHTVPKGGWKCKWCVCCVQCGSNTAGFHCEWQNNYTHCGPCASLVTCPVCKENFMEEELLLQCQHCDRWVHAVCESLYTEDEVEQASDEGFACTSCSPYVPRPVVESSIMASIKIKEPEPQFYRLEGVWLTESGMSLLRSISMSPLLKRRQRRSRLGALCCDGGPDGMDLRFVEGDGEDGKGCGEAMECDPKMENPGSPDRDGGADRDLSAEAGADNMADCDGLKGGADEMEDGKKKKRKPYRPGIGGFMVRQRKCHTRLKKEFFAQLAGETTLDGHPIERTIEEGPHPDTDNIMDPKPLDGEEQAKKRRGRKKSKLEDMFPSYLQEAFFGKTLIDLSKKAVLVPQGHRPSICPVRPPLPAEVKAAPLQESKDCAGEHLIEQQQQQQQQQGEAPQVDRDRPGRCAGGVASSSSVKLHVSADSSTRAGEDVDSISDTPQGMDSQDSEQFFRKVLGVSDGSSFEGMKPILDGSRGESTSALPQTSVLTGSLPSAGMMENFPGLSQSPFFDLRDRGGLFSPEGGEESPWATPSTPATPSSPPTPTEAEGDGLSYNQRSLQRWEKDEELGELSTISPVLYANTNFPNLKQDHPDWASRCKQIMKIWRKVSAADKVPYLQKAKDNRAAQRINKAQKQAEIQVCRPIKTEPVRVKGERPSLHLQIPPPSSCTSISSQPSSAGSPFPYPPDSGSSSVFFSDGHVKTPGSADIRTDPLARLPPQSPHSHSHPNTPFSYAGASPIQASSSGFSSCGPQGPPQGRPASLGPFDMQPGTPGTPRRAQQVDPYFRSQLQQQQGHLPPSQQGSQESLGPPDSPHSRGARPGGSPMFSPTHSGHYGDSFKTQLGIGRPEYTSSPSPSAVASSPLQGQYRAEGSVPSPRSSLARADVTSGSPAGMLDSGDGLFKAPMMPRMHQGDGGTPHPGASPSHHSEGYRQSPSHSFSDPHSQLPATLRPSSADSCSLAAQRLSGGQQEGGPRVPSSPQSHGSCQSPLTPGGNSNDAFSVQSPATPRFQSPEHCSRPPSRPQSRDAFATIHKPLCPVSGTPEATPTFKSSPHSNQQLPVNPPSGSSVDPLAGKATVPPPFSPSSGPQPQGLVGAGHAPPPQLQSATPADNFSVTVAPVSGSQELTVRPSDASQPPAGTAGQEIPEMSAAQDPALVGLSPSELEKHKQRQKLREFLIRQQMQRNSMRQEKEAAAAAAAAAAAGSGSPGWTEGEMAAFTHDKPHRAPPPYPQDRVSGAQTHVVGKMPMAAVGTEGNLIRPAPAGTPAIMDPRAQRCCASLRQPGPSSQPGMFARPPLPPHWHGQAPGPRRFPHPTMETMGVRHNIQAMESMASPHAVMPGAHGGEGVQSIGLGPPPQFIELRHNSQRLPLPRPQFMPRGPQHRPRMFVPQHDMSAAYVQQHPLVQAGGHPEGSGPQVMLQQGAVSGLLQPHQTPATVSGPGQNRLVHQNPVSVSQSASVSTNEDLPEADLEALEAAPGDGGVEDDDDLALDLDPDKGDDDLGNLDNLETNDPHLDDLLNSDEFDLLAYTDPELDQGDPKDGFSDQLRLVEAESETPSLSGSKLTKAEPKGSGEPERKPLSSSAGLPVTQTPSADEVAGPLKVKVESRGLAEQTVVKDEMVAAVSLLLGETTSSVKPAQSENPSLSSVRLGEIQYPLPSQTDALPFPPAAAHSDIDDDALELPDVGGQHSPAVDLAKVESSLDGELPLLIQDLLEHEKKEQQKQQQQQQLSSLQQGGMARHLSGLQGQQPNTQAPPGQIMLPQHHRAPPPAMLAQPGMVPRAQHVMQPQQRLMGPGMTPHMAMNPHQAMIRMGQPGMHTGPGHPQHQQPQIKQSLPNNFFPDKELDKFATDDILDPIAKAKMVALKGIKRVLAQEPMVGSPGINRQQVSLLAQRLASAPGTDPGPLVSGPPKEGEAADPTPSRPNPPQFVQGIINDAEQHQYEEWLLHTQQLLQMQLKFLEEQIGVHRKSRKALCAKQRTAKKAGREFAEADAEKLKLVTEEQSKIQKQLDQVRKQQKEHTNLIAEYRSKQQQHQQGSGLMVPGHPVQGGPPHMFPKMGGQMVMGQQGAPVIGQHAALGPHGGMPVRVPQNQPFMGAAQAQVAAGPLAQRPPCPPGAAAGFFPQGPGMQGPDPRLLQERQMQQRMQMAKLQQQQQAMMGQQPGPVGQPQASMMGNQASVQQGISAGPSNQAHTGLPGNQQVNLMPQNPVAHPGNHNQAMMAAPPGMMGNPTGVHQQRPQLMMVQQGMVESAGHPCPPLTPQQQQNILAQRMLASQQQGAPNNMAHLQQQQQQRQATPQSTSEQGRLSQPSTPQMGSSPSAGSLTPQHQGAADGHSKEAELVGSDVRTPPQRSGSSTPSMMPLLDSAKDPKTDLGQQVMGEPQSHGYVMQQQHSNLQQPCAAGNQQTGVAQQLQPSSLEPNGDNPTLSVKEEVKPAELLTPQQHQQTPVKDATQTSHDPCGQQQMGQNNLSQPQQVLLAHHPHQQALLTQQQKQQAMMGMIRAQQQGLMGHRPGVPSTPLRTPINIQAIIAQNPQLRNLPPNQQIQHIQAMIAQRQLQQGQMLRMSVGPGHHHQLRPHLTPSGQQVPRMEGQQMPYSDMGKQQQQFQQRMMVPGLQQAGGMVPQHMVRGQVAMPRSPLDQSRMVRPGSPRQPLASSPGDPPRQVLAMQPPNPNQQAVMAVGRMQGSPSNAYSPRAPFGMSPAHPASPLSSHVSSPSMSECRGGRGSPYNQVKVSPLRSPGAKSPLDCPGPRTESQVPSSETIPNGPEGPPSVHQQLPQVKDAPHMLPSSKDGGEVCRLTLQNIKQEPREVQCAGVEVSHGAVKREAAGDPVPSGNNSQLMSAETPGSAGPQSETGQQLLQKLLRTKNLQLGAQRPSEGIHNEINGHINSKLALLEQKLQGTPRNMEDLQSLTKRTPLPKPKRTNKPGGDRGINARKKNRKEDVGKSAEALIKQIKQGLSLLPLMEPSITASLDLFAPFGSSPADEKALLKGTFGNAVLDDIPDYYSQLLTKCDLSNPPTPPSSLPPTPPPSVQHKLVNGMTPGGEMSDGQRRAEPEEELLGECADLRVRTLLTAARETRCPASAGSVKEKPKSVDILAALPTPPHNHNEDIRMESDEEEDPPETIIPASSPESGVGEETPRFPHLREPKEEETERAISPIIPLIPRTAIPAFTDEGTLDAAQGTAPSAVESWDKRKSNEVAVTFMLTSAAAKKLNHVMMAMAQLLKIRMPVSYEVTFPPQNPDAQAVDAAGKLTGCDGAPVSQDEWLRQFDVSLPGCTLKKQVDILALIKQEFPDGDDRPAQHCYTTKVSDLDVRHLPVIPVEESPPPSPLPPPSRAPDQRAEPARTSGSPATAPASPVALRIKVEPQQQDAGHAALSSHASEDGQTPAAREPEPSCALDSSPKAMKQRRPLSPDEELVLPKVKKWKGIRWKRLQLVITIRKGGSKKESSREVSELMERLRITLRPERLPRDRRKCCFCHEEGDGSTDGPARLLNIDVDLWVHLNCALWSTEVYETQGGALINVEVALRRGLRTLCACCQKTGATNSCNRLRCPNVYHFACAIRARCMFFKDKTMLCTQHKLKGPSDDELSTFAVLRRVYIERDEVKQIASILQRSDRVHLFRVGGLIFHAVGQLLPSQLANFHSPTAIFPIGYEATRIYWSTRLPNKRCRYRCRISEEEGRPLFEVRVLEHGLEDLHYRDSSPDGIWEQIVQQVAKLRDDSSMLKLFTDQVKGEEMYGLTIHAVMRITESLPGVENCQNYQFRYGRHPLMELPLMINPSGSARSEPKVATQCKRPHTLNSTSVSKAYQSTFTGEMNTPYSKQFVHSKSSQYRRLKTEWKNNVYLARSRIQGLGLYAAKDLEKHTMVIEYIGTVIRNEVANRREKIYESQNRGIYMFRINNEQVIDATLTGGPARYVNHSCAPNCVAEVVTFDKEDKIIIISSRRIPKGEELTYDYQFDFEDDQNKIPCHCGAWNCRKWMN